MQYRGNVETASPQSGDILAGARTLQPPAGAEYAAAPDRAIPVKVLQELWELAEAGACGLPMAEFEFALESVGRRLNYGCAPGICADMLQAESFLRSLRLPDLALAQACARGREAAWQRFIELYRSPLTQAATAITGSATLGHDLADSLYAELYGMKEKQGERQSPLFSYSGRGSLLGWLRTTLAQRHVDHHRRTHREAPLEGIAEPHAAAGPERCVEPQLAAAVSETLRGLNAEDRYLLVSYFLDRAKLSQIAQLLRVHEATISRRLKRLTGEVRKSLLRNLQAVGLSRRAAEEALATDPRDLEINLRALLQTSQLPPFSDQPKRTKDTA